MNQKEDPTSNNNKVTVKLCPTRDCGFYGSDRYKGFCSGCWNQQKVDETTVKQGPPSDSITRSNKGHCVNDIIPIDLSPLVVKSRTTIQSSNYKISSNQSNLKSRTSFKSISTKSMRIGLDYFHNEIMEEKMVVYGKDLHHKNEIIKKKIIDRNEDHDTNKINGGGKQKQPKKRTKVRCSICPRSIQVIGFDCRCGGRYCIEHRLAKEHLCQFDYRSQGINELAKANPKIVSDKIKKI